MIGCCLEYSTELFRYLLSGVTLELRLSLDQGSSRITYRVRLGLGFKSWLGSGLDYIIRVEVSVRLRGFNLD